MNKNHEAKALVVDEIRSKWEASHSIVLIDYRGLTVEEDTRLRRATREAGVEYRVLKNTMIYRAIENMGIEGVDDHLKGPTAVAFGLNDAVAPAKVISDFIKSTHKMTIKCGVMDGKMISPAAVQALADLPPKDVLLSRLLGGMNAPITSFVGVLSATIRSLVYALNAVKETKDA